jgi:DNA (cytosine-5)-methyltransferase 1
MYTLTKADVHGVAQPIPLNSMNCFRSPDAAAGTGCGLGEEGEAMFTISKTNHHAVAQPIGGVDYENNAHLMNQPTGPLLKGSPTGGGRPLPALVYPMAVRRLTPVECERLQGFPDNYTEIPWRGKAETPDGPRYKALGNSMAVPVMKWIGERIALHPSRR